MKLTFHLSALTDQQFSAIIFKRRLDLTDLRLIKCCNITDRGIETMTCLLKDLRSLYIEECPRITDFSKKVVQINCGCVDFTHKL